MKRSNAKHLYEILDGSGLRRHFAGSSWQPPKKQSATLTTVVFLFLFLFVAALVFAGWSVDFGSFILSGASSHKSTPTPRTKIIEFPLQCVEGANVTQTCPRTYPSKPNFTNHNHPSNVTCPSYFRWIHEDLRPWKKTGITRDMVERARKTAHFRLVIVDGKAYLEKYKQSIQTRDMFTLWGILQLLRVYPGRLPDLEIMFDCDDRPVIPLKDFPGPNAGPPPVFRYCSNDTSLDIVFPDWSFWGWAEINIKPWKTLLPRIKEGNKKTKWKDRVPYAYWKGNPWVYSARIDLLKCNVTDQNDYHTHLYIQDWEKESKERYKQSSLEDQCKHRYKIYVEGYAWSVSEKYILACDSMTLYLEPRYYDFYMRGMLPLAHYWPIRNSRKCESLKFAVEWGNNHTEKAEAIGEAASNFIQEHVKMEYVYDYMFHVLNEYAKLLKFKPTVPPNAVELCSETLACPATGTSKKFMEESMVMSPSDDIPCSLPPPYDPQALHDFLQRKANSFRQVDDWEYEYRQSQ